MRVEEALVALMKSVAWQAMNGTALRHDLTLGALFGTSGDGAYPEVHFGYGYHNWNEAVYYPAKTDADPNPSPLMLSFEEAARRFCDAHFGKEPEQQLFADPPPIGRRPSLQALPLPPEPPPAPQPREPQPSDQQDLPPWVDDRPTTFTTPAPRTYTAAEVTHPQQMPPVNPDGDANPPQ